MSWRSQAKKEGIFCTVYFVRSKFFKHLCFISMYGMLNTLSEYICFYMLKNITSQIFLLVFKIVESLQCILKKELRIFIQFLKSFVQFRGSVHTQTATLNVKLTFVDVWVKMSDIRAVAKMSKTNFQNTMCNNSNTK